MVETVVMVVTVMMVVTKTIVVPVTMDMESVSRARMTRVSRRTGFPLQPIRIFYILPNIPPLGDHEDDKGNENCQTNEDCTLHVDDEFHFFRPSYFFEFYVRNDLNFIFRKFLHFGSSKYFEIFFF